MPERKALLDSNIIIYAAQAEHEWLRQWIAEHTPAVSAISVVEVLGFDRLSDVDRTILKRFFEAAEVLPITQPVLDIAVSVRQRRRMTLGDSLQAATAIAHGRVLVTRNLDDFKWITELTLLDPFLSRSSERPSS